MKETEIGGASVQNWETTGASVQILDPDLDLGLFSPGWSVASATAARAQGHAGADWRGVGPRWPPGPMTCGALAAKGKTKKWSIAPAGVRTAVARRALKGPDHWAGLALVMDLGRAAVLSRSAVVYF